MLESFIPNIRDAVALRIRAAYARRPGQIHAEAVGRTESGPLSDQHDHHRRSHPFANFIANRDSSLLHDHNGRCPHRIKDTANQPRRMAMDRERGESSGDDED